MRAVIAVNPPVGTAPGVLAVKQTLLIRPGNGHLCGRRLQPPARQQGVQGLRRGNLRPDAPRQARPLRIAHRSVNPRIGHIATHHRHRHLLRQNSVGEIAESTDAHPDPWQFDIGLIEECLDLFRPRWSMIVTRVDQRQPGLVWPVRRGHEIGAVTFGGVHGEQPRSIRAFPEKEARHPRRTAGGVATEVEEIHAGVFQQGRHDPRMRRHVGHLGVARQR